jgi:hypothetical protein
VLAICYGAPLLAALALASPAAAAPSEGTAGQTVTTRSTQRAHSMLHASPGQAIPAVRIEAAPLWKDLSSAQQQALQPLAPYWSQLSEERKRKWLSISRNFSSLPPQEQAKLHQRMTQWVKLTQRQRNQARQIYQQIQALPPERRNAEWETYQALSAEEKRRLAAQAGIKPSAAPAVKSAVSKPKLAAVTGPRGPDFLPALQPPTLLPQAVRPAPEASPYEDEPAE